MTVRMTFTQHADPGTVFARTAFDDSVGQPFAFASVVDPLRTGTLVKAVVAPDGGSVELTIELEQMPSEMRDAVLSSHFRLQPGHPPRRAPRPVGPLGL